MDFNIKFILILLLIFLFVIAICVYLYIENNLIQVTNIDIKDSNIPKNFDNFKILQISDFHNKEFGKNQENITNKIKEISPDIIVITGDLITSYDTNVEVSLDLINSIVKCCPVYYVAGNHESRILNEYNLLKERMKLAGVKILENEYVQITKDNEKINIIGVKDPSFEISDYLGYTEEQIMSKNINDLTSKVQGYTILLSHRPELFETYFKYNINLVFSGHAHGGQMRIPFIGGIVAPNQGLFPKYTSGLHEKRSYKDDNKQRSR